MPLFFVMWHGGWIILLTVLMKIFSLQRVLKFSTTCSAKTDQFIAPDRIVSVLDQFLGLNFLAFTPTCWKRAIILHRFLALTGIHHPHRLWCATRRCEQIIRSRLARISRTTFSGISTVQIYSHIFFPRIEIKGILYLLNALRIWQGI